MVPLTLTEPPAALFEKLMELTNCPAFEEPLAAGRLSAQVTPAPPGPVGPVAPAVPPLPVGPVGPVTPVPVGPVGPWRLWTPVIRLHLYDRWVLPDPQRPFL